MCDHEAIQVRGICYYDIKVKAGLMEGRQHLGSLSAEQAAYVGLLETPQSTDGWSAPGTPDLPPTNLERRRDQLRPDERLHYVLSERTAQQVADQ